MHRHDATETPRCVSHGKICSRPSVENFTPTEQANFEQFCGALLKVLSAQPSAARAMEPLGDRDHIGLD